MAGASTARNATDRALVVVFLRGAMDGLMAVQPLGDSFLRAARPSLLLTPGRGELPPLDLGNGFALHPALAPLLPIWQRGEMAVVHGCGSPHPTRSHFDAQDFMETATPGRKGVEDGWLNRLARSNGADRALFGAVSLTGMAPRSLQGPAPALAIPDLQRFQLARPAAGGAALEALYRDSPDGLLRSRGAELFDSLRLLGSEEVAAYRSARAARYPKSPLAQSLMQIAFLLRQGVGLRIGFAESGGWDTHIRQGREQGSFAVRAGDLAASLAAFWEDLGDLADRVTVLTMTEFGRTVAENGTGGTDHGHGSCLFLLGRNVHGARVHGSLPELRPEELFAGRDLPVTTDFRAVLCDVADKVFGVRDDEFLFPGWYGAPADVLWG
ncbi:MAG: DUF1501 domain-containing protein [Acidobacteria bacterium]|nr:MAG: DUF1501 domain-containing protein [Acidobacteriota bacterium]REK00461.1 MAG: DUF1501 domain-containing protein [Acidobacteriota bacterium]